MPDWRRLVERRLRNLKAPRARRDEIERELAGFLEDSYEHRMREGARPRGVLRDVIGNVGGWPQLAAALEREQIEMKTRLQALWLPVLVVGLTGVTLTRLPHASWGGVSIVRLDSGQMMAFVWTWLLMLPLVGALGAEWSRRMGGGRREQVLVALAPAFALVIVFALMVVLAGRPASQFPQRGPIPGRLLLFVNLVLVPTLALLLGCLPALLRRVRPTETTQP
jgi:hypothetical protein